MKPAIYSTKTTTKLACWDDALGDYGAVAIATTGSWRGTVFNLTGGSSGDRNHAKIGVSTSGNAHYAIFGDMNQQGSAVPPGNCASSQNGRGGLFYAINDNILAAGVTDLIKGDTAPTKAPKPH
jgi:hypothetical protein